MPILLPRGLVRAFVFPLHERLRGRRTPRFLANFAANDRLGRADLEALHAQLLVHHLGRAARSVPYYRDRIDPASISAPADLARFPLLDKPSIRAIGDRLRSTSFAGRLLTLETGGSSGEPLRFHSDQGREASQLACKWRARAWFGIGPGHREADLWGSPIETGRLSFGRRVAGALLGFQLLSAFRLNDETMEGFAARLSNGRADLVYGYASVLARYARWLEARGRTLGGRGPRLVVSTAEMLLDADRAVIARAFGCPVANEYGCRDGGLIAHECPEGRLHLMHDAVHVEILDAGGRPLPPGETGEIVVTNLHAEAFPMIRYRLGDRASMDPDPCPCGCPHPVLRALEGRLTDTVVRSDGTRVHGLALIYVLRELPGVARFRCVQSERGAVEIFVVPGSDFDPAAIESGLAARVRRVLGDDTRVGVRLVDDLEPLPSGKHRFVLCTVPD